MSFQRIHTQQCQVLHMAQPTAWIIPWKTVRWFTVSWTKVSISRRSGPQECFRQLENSEKTLWRPNLLKDNIFQICVKQTEMLQEKINQMPPHQGQHKAFQMSSSKILYLLFQFQSHVLQHHTATSNPMTGGWGKRQANKKEQTTLVSAQEARSFRSALFPRARTDPKCLSPIYLCHIHSPKSRLLWAAQLENLNIDSNINFFPPTSSGHSIMLITGYALSSFSPTSALSMQNLKPHIHLCSIL